ncbi:MAG: hypothetical protein ANABAC_1307 [Anaerolineae bacterium]|nr:MAG: hypothetical protein ANABAC_1307 [Anaerolineae bacterium]
MLDKFIEFRDFCEEGQVILGQANSADKFLAHCLVCEQCAHALKQWKKRKGTLSDGTQKNRSTSALSQWSAAD